MLQRVAYGLLAITVLVTLFLLDILIAAWAGDLEGPLGALLRRGSVLPFTFLVVLLLGAFELNRLFHLKAVRPHATFAYVIISALLLAPWLSAAGWLGSGAAQVEGIYWQVVLLMVATIGAGVMAVLRRDPQDSLRDLGATLVLIFYLGFLGSFGLQLRCGCDVPEQTGVWLLLILVLVTKASDIGAYFVGSTLGRHKLIPAISPAKSIEGTVGGLLASAAAAVLIAVAASTIIPQVVQGAAGPDGVGFRSSGPDGLGFYLVLLMLTGSTGTSPLLQAALFGIFMSAAGQFGDFVESSFKRDACVKDSGKVIPRFGGILDLVDSPLFAMPIGWLLLTSRWGVL